MQAANQLDALRQMSKVVADTGEIGAIERYRPVDCTTNPRHAHARLSTPRASSNLVPLTCPSSPLVPLAAPGCSHRRVQSL
jgi:hypothetical protein